MVSIIKGLVVFGVIFFSLSSQAGLFLNYSLNYHSDTDGGDAEAFSLSRINNNLFLGATLDSAKKFMLGTNFSSWNKSQSKGDGDTEKTISQLEIGPRLHCYLSQNRAWFVTLTYNFYSKGTGTVSGADATFDGTGLMSSLGYHLKTSKSFAMGASLNYHSTTISSRIINSAESEVTDTYVSIYPMLEMVLRY